MKNRTPNRLPNNLYLGDVDGDGIDEFLQVANNRLLVFRTNFEATGVLHHYFPYSIVRLIIGDFTTQGREHGREQVCVILGDGNLYGYAISDDLQELWWGFTQPSFVTEDAHVIVGDFDGDGADDLLVHNQTSGALRMYGRMTTNFNTPFAMKNFSQGDLGTANLAHKEILVGKFGRAVGHDDLLVVDHLAGQISRYDSATDSTGAHTFHRSFTTNTGLLTTHDQVIVANLDGGPTEGILIHNIQSRTTHLFKVENNHGTLADVPNVSLGQLPVYVERSVFASARLKEVNLRSEPGGMMRHDFLLFDRNSGQITRTDGRYDLASSRLTYWYAYKKDTPSYHQGWPTRREHKWAVLLSHLADNSSKPRNPATGQSAKASFFKDLFTATGIGRGGMTDYFLDISYGTLDLGRTEVLPTDDNAEWYKSRYTTQDRPRGTVEDPVDHTMKEARQALFDDIVRTSGSDLSKYTHTVVVFNVPDTGYGGSPDPNWVTLDPLDALTFNGFGTSGMAQEMLHAYSLNHSFNDRGITYGDRWDVMSAFDVASFTNAQSLVPMAPQGPELNAAYKAWMGFLPESRMLTLSPIQSHPLTFTVQLAALNRPEASGFLAVKIQLPITAGSGIAEHAVFVEFRQKTFWDRNIPNDMVVLLHEYVRKEQESFFQSGMSYLLQSQGGPEFVEGMTFKNAFYTVTVKEVHGSNHQKDVFASTATLSITC